MSTRDEPDLPAGSRFSTALDPHRRASLQRALDVVLGSYDQTHDEPPCVALIGWEAATLIDDVYERAVEVVVVEERDLLVESIQDGLFTQERGKKVKLVTESPDTVELADPVDVAVASATSTWFIEGTAADTLDNVRRNVLAEDGTMIPRRFFHLFELASPPNEVGGMPLRVPRTSRPGEPVPILSESKHFTTTDLTDPEGIADEIDDTIIVKPLLEGELTALRLKTVCELAEGVVQTTSEAGLQSILVPLREDCEIEPGQPVSIYVRYEPGSGLETTRFSARTLQDDTSDEWAHTDHEVTRHFQKKIAEMIDVAEQRGRGDDLEKVVDYTVEPQGDVSRLAAFFWTIDEEYRKPVRDIVDDFRSRASSEIGEVPDDDVVYDMMLEVYKDKFPDVAARFRGD